MDIWGNSRNFARKIAKQKANYGSKNYDLSPRRATAGKSQRHIDAEGHQKAISMVRGVEKVTLPHRKRLSAYERSLRDLEEGHVYEAKDVDDLFKQCLE